MTVKEVIDQIHDNELYFDIHEQKDMQLKNMRFQKKH